MNKQIRIPYSGTTIAPERTKADIERMLKEHGIQDIQWTSLSSQTSLKFLWHFKTAKGVEKTVGFEFKPPVIPSVKRSWTGVRYEKVHVNLEATSYRLLWHYLKNKLQAVKWGLESMEKEFLSHAVLVLPDGRETTIGEHIDEVLTTVQQFPALEKRDESKVVDVQPTQMKYQE